MNDRVRSRALPATPSSLSLSLLAFAFFHQLVLELLVLVERWPAHHGLFSIARPRETAHEALVLHDVAAVVVLLAECPEAVHHETWFIDY